MKNNHIPIALAAMGLLAGVIRSEATLTQYQAAVQATPGLISHYKFDAGNANDNFGVNNGATGGGASYVSGVGSGSDQALNFTGASYDNFGAVPAFNFASGTGTVEMWVRAGWAATAAPDTTSRTLVGNFEGITSPYFNYTLAMQNDKSAIVFWGSGTWQSIPIPAAGTIWHHMAVVFNANSWTLVWDGVSIYNSTIPWSGFTGGQTTLGSDMPSGAGWLSTPWIGDMDEVAFYSTALSPSSVQAHRDAFYASAVPPAVAAYQAAVTAEVSLISYYKFDTGDAADSKGVNTGTPGGTAGFVTGIGGGSDQALNLDGNGWVNFGAVPAFDFASGTGTIEMWVRAGWTNTPASSVTLVGNFDGTAAPYFNYTLAMLADKSGIVYWGSGYWQYIPIPAAGTNWHHLAVVFNAGTSWTLVWDGVSVWTSPITWSGLSAGQTQLGSDMPGGAGWLSVPWIGNQDEVAFYSSALPVSSIQAHHTAYTGVSTPVIVTQPVGGILPVGEHFQMSGSGTGGSLIYSWRKNGSVISGAASSTLDFPSTSAADTGAYQLVITNNAGSATSAVAQVTVLAANLGSYRQKVTSESSLVSYYKFDDSTANDYVGSNHGTPAGGVIAYDASLGGSPTNKALDLFSTTNPADYSWVDVGAVPALQCTDGSGTVEFWMQCNWTNGTYESSSDPVIQNLNPAMVCSRNQDNPSGNEAENWGIFVTMDKTGLFLWTGGYFPVTLPTPAGDSWHHCAVVFSTAGSTNATIIWDGAPLITFTNAPVGGNPLATVLIGATASWGRGPFLGKLDEVAFYADALSTTAVQNHVRAAYGLSSNPVLNTAKSGNNLVLSWVDPGNWVLESTAQLSPASWTPVQTNGSPATVQISGNKFFRLKAQ